MARINISDNSGPERFVYCACYRYIDDFCRAAAVDVLCFRILSLEADLDTILEILTQCLEKMEVGLVVFVCVLWGEMVCVYCCGANWGLAVVGEEGIRKRDLLFGILNDGVGFVVLLVCVLLWGGE